ncbi:unnamed protein product [Cuscuta campestris]|uniref:Uncharacterized protein n=1 Tax=Cuscuta campestris TaxID=132261 RepID=A0A484LTY0_9ASTE|nr:unnamed protein product [Cuscuta campestris]
MGGGSRQLSSGDGRLRNDGGGDEAKIEFIGGDDDFGDLVMAGPICGGPYYPMESQQDEDTSHPNSPTTQLKGKNNDQVIISALLGSCTNTIQPLISMVETSAATWKNFTTSFASASRGRVVSLKSKLSKKPRGTRSIQEFLNDMQSIANDLALAQHPVPEMDLTVHVLNQMGEEYDSIVSVARVLESPLPFTELGDILKEHETKLKAAEESTQSLVATAHATERSSSASHGKQQFTYRRRMGSRDGNSRRGRDQSHGDLASTSVCRYCQIPGHTVQVCRKLAKFLRENGLSTISAPSVNTATGGFQHLNAWMFDSHHTSSSLAPLQAFSDYGGPDEVDLYG